MVFTVNKRLKELESRKATDRVRRFFSGCHAFLNNDDDDDLNIARFGEMLMQYGMADYFANELVADGGASASVSKSSTASDAGKFQADDIVMENGTAWQAAAAGGEVLTPKMMLERIRAKLTDEEAGYFAAAMQESPDAVLPVLPLLFKCWFEGGDDPADYMASAIRVCVQQGKSDAARFLRIEQDGWFDEMDRKHPAARERHTLSDSFSRRVRATALVYGVGLTAAFGAGVVSSDPMLPLYALLAYGVCGSVGHRNIGGGLLAGTVGFGASYAGMALAMR